MNRKQWQSLLSLLFNWIVWAILAFSGFVIYLSGKMSTLYIIGCAGCVLWTSFMWFMPFVKRIRDRSKYPMDERDLMITQKSVLVGFISIWIYLIGLSIVLWFIAGAEGALPIGVFPVLLYVGMGIFATTSNLSACFLYRDHHHSIEGGLS